MIKFLTFKFLNVNSQDTLFQLNRTNNSPDKKMLT